MSHHLDNHLLLVIDREGNRLCRDGRYRSHAFFGTPRSAASQYRNVASARRAAKRAGGYVVALPEGVTIEMGGTVIKTIPAGKDHVRYEHSKPGDWLIPGEQTRLWTEHTNDLSDIPAAACPRCGGWTSFGGCSQHSQSRTLVLDRTGCRCKENGTRERVHVDGQATQAPFERIAGKGTLVSVERGGFLVALDEQRETLFFRTEDVHRLDK